MEGILTGVHGMGLVVMIVAIHEGCVVTGEPVALGARGQLPSGSMLSIWRVLKQFA